MFFINRKSNVNKEPNEKGLSSFIKNLEIADAVELGNLRLDLYNRKDPIEEYFIRLKSLQR